MTVTTGNITFDRDAEGNLIGITLVRPKHLLEGNGGGLRITLPVPSDVPAGELTPALSA